MLVAPADNPVGFFYVWTELVQCQIHCCCFTSLFFFALVLLVIRKARAPLTSLFEVSPFNKKPYPEPLLFPRRDHPATMEVASYKSQFTCDRFSILTVIPPILFLFFVSPTLLFGYCNSKKILISEILPVNY